MSEIIRVRNTSSWILFYVSLQIINYASKFLFAVESISLIRLIFLSIYIHINRFANIQRIHYNHGIIH